MEMKVNGVGGFFGLKAHEPVLPVKRGGVCSASHLLSHWLQQTWKR